MERQDPATVLVVDDDERLVASLRRVLAYEGYRVLTAVNGLAGLQLARDESPDLIILDVMLPGVDGLEFARRLQAGGGVPVLMLSARDSTEDKVAGLEAGADDYLVKPFATQELLARVKARLRRREPDAAAPPASTLRFADLVLDTGAREARRGDRFVRLTSKEYDLLALFMRHPRRVLPHAYILEQVWGYDFEGESNVVPVYVGQLRQKLEAGGESRLIHTVRHAGYVLRE
ncbi:MAG: response regulator transcription factor [Chloroflexota bacterium]|nr:response regulator transcription factor [Chloroflexota bacterium]